jgi:hypothetical protein
MVKWGKLWMEREWRIVAPCGMSLKWRGREGLHRIGLNLHIKMHLPFHWPMPHADLQIEESVRQYLTKMRIDAFWEVRLCVS